MSITPSYNYVTFTPDPWIGTAPRIVLKCGAINRRGGLQPDVWVATVPYTDIDALSPLGQIIGEITGNLEFWYDHNFNSGEPSEMTIANVAIVDVQIDRIGKTPADADDKPLVYRISIADHRRAWVAPRGGILMEGRINPQPPVTGGPTLTNTQMIRKCLDAMGVTASIADVSGTDDLADLDWSCAHAPSELQRLLEHTGTVYAPLISGNAQIVKPGTASVPTIPRRRLLRSVQCTAVDRRAGAVVFTSAPAPRIFSFDDEAGDDVPTWKYVVFEPGSGKWVTEAESGDLGDGFADAWRSEFDDVGQGIRAHYQAQLYRCIQLDRTRFPLRRVRLLAQFVTVALGFESPRVNNSDLLVRDVGGSFVKGGGAALLVEKVIPEANVLIFPHALMKIATGAQARRLHLSGQEVCIPETELKPQFSVEAWDATGSQRDYGIYGAIVAGGSVSGIGRTLAKSYLKGYRPGVSVFHSPDLVNVLLNGGVNTGDRNTEAMQARAEKYAASALGVTTPATVILEIKGPYPVEIDACVSEVSYDVAAARTTVICNGWHATGRTSGEAIDFGDQRSAG